MAMRKWFGTAAVFTVVSVVSPQPASADWVLTPFVGWNFKGAAEVNGSGGTTFSDKFEKKIDYGVSIATMGGGPVGFELDFGYSPNFFETGTATNNQFRYSNDSNVTTLTGNAIVALSRGGVRPYVVGGVGIIRTNLQDAKEVFNVSSKNDFGFDVGGGVMGFFSQNVGIRGDVRYFRSFKGSTENAAGLGLSDFNFWRGSVGLSFKF